MAFIFAASSVPGSQVPAAVWDKLAHFLVYAALGAFFLLPLAQGRPSGVTGATMATAVALSFLYGLTDEAHQMFTPGRSPDMYDVIADTIGATAGVAFAGLVALVWRMLAARRRGLDHRHPRP
jgi:VanZ family protein